MIWIMQIHILNPDMIYCAFKLKYLKNELFHFKIAMYSSDEVD